jgi:hypothetical protein
MTESFNPRLLKRLEDTVDLQHPWVTKYRVPPVDSLYPSFAFIASLATGGDMLDNFLAPTDEDAALVGAYIDYYKSYWYGDSYLRQLAQYPLDLDGGANTTSFALSNKGWVYRKSTWQGQPQFPYWNSEIQYGTLLDLINSIETRSDNGINPRWTSYKLDHNIKG